MKKLEIKAKKLRQDTFKLFIAREKLFRWKFSMIEALIYIYSKALKKLINLY